MTITFTKALLIPKLLKSMSYLSYQYHLGFCFKITLVIWKFLEGKEIMSCKSVEPISESFYWVNKGIFHHFKISDICACHERDIAIAVAIVPESKPGKAVLGLGPLPPPWPGRGGSQSGR